MMLRESLIMDSPKFKPIKDLLISFLYIVMCNQNQYQNFSPKTCINFGLILS